MTVFSRNSDQLESSLTYAGRSADYAWQLLIAAAAIVVSTPGIPRLILLDSIITRQ